MSSESTDESRSIIWRGKPWIYPRLIFRSVTIIFSFFLLIWLELFVSIGFQTFQGIPVVLWTALTLFLFWLVSIFNLLWIKASNTYILRNASLEITTGLLTSRSFVIAPSGFANMEVVRTLISRILNTGDIIIRTQDEPYGDKKMVMVNNAEDVGDKIRNVMSKPVVRLEK